MRVLDKLVVVFLVVLSVFNYARCISNPTATVLSGYPPKAIIMAWLSAEDISYKFDSYGAGKPTTEYNNWQICNGNNYSPNMNGRAPLGFIPNDYEFGSKVSGGSEYATLYTDNIPAHSHNINLPTNEVYSHTHLYLDTMFPTKQDGEAYDYKNGYGDGDFTTIFDERKSKSDNTRLGKTATAGAHSHKFNGKTENVGYGTPVKIMQPYLSLVFIMYTGTLESVEINIVDISNMGE